MIRYLLLPPHASEVAQRPSLSLVDTLVVACPISVPKHQCVGDLEVVYPISVLQNCCYVPGRLICLSFGKRSLVHIDMIILVRRGLSSEHADTMGIAIHVYTHNFELVSSVSKLLFGLQLSRTPLASDVSRAEHREILHHSHRLEDLRWTTQNNVSVTVTRQTPSWTMIKVHGSKRFFLCLDFGVWYL